MHPLTKILNLALILEQKVDMEINDIQNDYKVVKTLSFAELVTMLVKPAEENA